MFTRLSNNVPKNFPRKLKGRQQESVKIVQDLSTDLT